ncbi:MAG: hypothetical protein OXI15_24540 [Chromatiales bacterium]|nr:hypothetical protein [Chromatiales bacterium]
MPIERGRHGSAWNRTLRRQRFWYDAPMKAVSAELIAIIATGVALAGLLLASQHRLEDRLLASQHRLEDRLLAGQHRLEDRLLAVETEQARVGVILDRIEKELDRVEKEQTRFRMLHEGVEFTAHTHDTKPDKN